MNGDDAFKAVFGVILATVMAAVAWVFKLVFKNRESNVALEVRLDALEGRTMVTKAEVSEAIKEALKEALEERDERARERREEWDKRLALELRQAVTDGVNACRQSRTDENERQIRMIVREELDKSTSGRHTTEGG